MPKKVLFIAAIFPEPKSSAAGTRLLQLIHFFIKNQYQVFFVSTAEKTAYSFDLSQLGVEELNFKINDSSIDLCFHAINPNVVLFDRFYMEEQFGWRIAEICPHAMRILDTEDLHFIRKSRASFYTNKTVDESVKHRELAAIFRSDLALIISKFEQDYLLQHFPEIKNRVHYLPFLYEDTNKRVKSFRERKEVVFIGNGQHEPNIDAIMFLKHEIWPLIYKQNKNLKLSIYGAYLPKKILALHQENEGFFVYGRVENAFEVIGNARILIAPLRFGAGLKGKLMEAMLCGTPSITTTIGSEGIVTSNKEWPGFVSNKPQLIANKLIDLYFNQTLWELTQENGFKLLKKQFNSNKHEELFKTRLELHVNELNQKRQENYIGQMLMQQNTSASKFMSKWIEEKNKIKYVSETLPQS